MFSGIVEGLGKVVKVVRKSKDFLRISVDLGPLLGEVRPGDSVAINGACLTVTSMAGKIADFDVMGETLGKTDLGALAAGARVNLERSLKVGDRMGGHFVLGHVDGIGTIREKKADGDNCTITVGVPRELTAFMMPKGSVAVDGISLTLTGITPGGFSVALIPHTLKVTTLGLKKKGDPVNIEVDYIGKWVKSLVPEKLAKV